MYARYAELRDAKGLTDAKVAEATGIKQSIFSDWKKRCEKRPDSCLAFGSMLKIADVLGVDVVEAFGREEK